VTRVSTAELTERLPDILGRVAERGEQFIVERDGVALATIQPPVEPSGPTLHELAVLLADVPRPDAESFDDLEAIHAAMNVPFDLPQRPS
jgi:hypothetical protein